MGDLFNDLLKNYGRMVDDELIELARRRDDLTPEAQMALWSELGRRGIPEESWKQPESRTTLPRPASTGKSDSRDTADEDEGEPSAPAELVAVFSAENEQEAQRAQGLLRNAGI